jgi:hypothetical protein
MKITTITTVRLWCAVSLLVLASQAVKAQSNQPRENDNPQGEPDKNTVLYEGPLVHDEHWVITAGTIKNEMFGVFGGTCSMVRSNVRNVSAREHVRFEAEYLGLGVWNMAHTDTVSGRAVADTGQRYRYTYQFRKTFTGITTDGKAPNPNRAMPSSTNAGFLDVVPANVVAGALKFEDIFLLQDDATGSVVADAQVLASLHLRVNPAEQPPPLFPFVLEGYILTPTTYQPIAGQPGCDPL